MTANKIKKRCYQQGGDYKNERKWVYGGNKGWKVESVGKSVKTFSEIDLKDDSLETPLY